MQRVLSIIKKHKIVSVLIITLVLFLLARTILLKKPNTELTYTVTKDDLVDTVQVSGTYTTASQTQVISPTNGILTEVYVANNQYVEKNDPLFHVESTATESQKAAAYASYQAALSAGKTAQESEPTLQASLEAARTAVINAQSGVDYMNNNSINPATHQPYTQNEKDAINSALTNAKESFSAVELQYKNIGSTMAAKQAQIEATKRAYDETQSVTVKAPVSGTIVNLQQTVGDEVNASGTKSSPVLLIANLANPYLTAAISEDYIPRIAVGQKASIVFDGLKEKRFSGSVTSLDTVGTNTNGVVTYMTRIIATGIPSAIKPNMTALITIETLRKNGVLTVPNSALVTKNGKSYVIKANTNEKELLPVTVGIKGISKSEITEGVTSETVIVANPSNNL